LVAAAQAGDRQALDALLRRHYDRLFALCRRLTGSDADAADACQDGLIAIVRGLPRFDARAAFGTWAYRVVTNAALDELRRRRRRPAPGLPEDDDSSARRSPGRAGAGAVGGMSEPGGGDPADRTATRLDIDAALATLAPEFRAAVVLRDLCGLSYDEIAEVLDIPPGTVRSRIARARGALASLLAGEGNPPPSPRRQTDRT
jgi:RNA polymerase sigma-70 factor (ECF subfamily)